MGNSQKKLEQKKKTRILIVENDPAVARQLKEFLTESPLQISELKSATSLSTALKELNENPFDVVFLDLDLADSYGLDTLEVLSREYPRTAYIVITSKYEDAFITKIITKGAQDYLVKGNFNSETLQKSVTYAMERKWTTEILNRKQKNLEAIFDAVPIGMLLVDENMVVKRVNDTIRQLTQKDFLQIINRSVGTAINCTNSTYSEKGCGHSPDCKNCQFRKSIKNVLDSQLPIRDVEIQLSLKVNNQIIKPWFCMNAELVIIDGKKNVVIALNDIAKRKEAEEKLRETMEIKSNFISTVSHELRTPLACMKEAIAIVLDGVAGKINEKQKNFLDIAKRNVDRLTMLINDVLDFQKLESGMDQINIQTNDLNQVVREVYQTMLLSIEKKSIELSLELDGNLPKSHFDRDKIIQVLINLINNAIKFTPEKGQVCVSTRHRDDELAIAVRDTGFGMPKEVLSKIFDRFYRVKKPGREIHGTGLGLAIVNKIVMMHKGRIDVESELDHGTTFTVYLPIKSDSAMLQISEKTDEFLENIVITEN